MSGERQLPGLGLYGFWTLGSNGWKDQNDGNLRMLSALVQASVLSSVAAVPGSPTNGDRHLITAGGDANKIAIRDNGAWVYLVPAAGWTIFDIAAAVFKSFDGTSWAVSDTDTLGEGSTNLYFTEARVLSAVLTGFSLADSSDVDATDSVLVAMGKLQAQLDSAAGGPADTDALAEGVTNLYFTAGRVRSAVLTGLSLASATVISATDTVLVALGQLQAQITALLTATDNPQSGTTYTLVLTDKNKEIGLSHATGCALTIPTNASVAFPVGTRIPVWNDSVGTHTIIGASGVTLNGIAAGTPTGTLTVNASGVRGGVILRKTATDTWTVTGAIGAVA